MLLLLPVCVCAALAYRPGSSRVRRARGASHEGRLCAGAQGHEITFERDAEDNLRTLGKGAFGQVWATL